MKETLGLIAILLAFVAYIPYFRDILTKRTVPHPYSWFVWGFSSSLIFGIQITHGGGAGAHVTAVMAVLCILIGLLAYRNGVQRSITRSDRIVFVAAILAVILWLFVDQPVLSILVLVAADLMGIIPSVRKAWNKPYEETLSMWVVNGFRHGVAISALASYNLMTVLDPLTWVLTNFAFATLLIIRRRYVATPRRRVTHKATTRHK